MTQKGKYSLLLLFTIALAAFQVSAQEVENEFQARTKLKLSFEPLKDVKVSLTPEIRFNDAFDYDKFQIEGDVKYSPIKYLDLGASYRFIGNQNKDNETEFANRYAIYAKTQYKIERFKPSLRVSYTNFSDDDKNDHFLRYKIGTEYNIKKSKITPEISAEIFQSLTDSNLYKMRYSAGASYKLKKNNYIDLSYKFDYYMQEYRNKHIVSVGYKLKF